jgi:peroxiredoxin
MKSYYSLMGIEPTASQDEIEKAYKRQSERYDPARVSTMDEEIRRIAVQRTAELQHAYTVLSDPQKRKEYDQSIGLQQRREQSTETPAPSQTRHARERWFALGGAIVGVVLIVIIWLATQANGTNVPTAPKVNRIAPDFTLLTPEGKEISLSDYRGDVVLVNFWGSWCEPCVHELPELQAAHERLSDQGFVVIGVNLFDDEQQTYNHTVQDIQQFVEENGITYPVVLDNQGEVTEAYRVFPIPTSFFVDTEGNIRYVLPRELTTEEIVAWFTELKQEATALHETLK